MGKFSITVKNDGQFYFHLKADNGQVILSSEGYTSRSGCDNGIESVRKNSQDVARYENITAQNGKFYFVLRAVNGQVIGRSQFYESESGRYNGIMGVMKNGTAEIVEYDDNVKPVKQTDTSELWYHISDAEIAISKAKIAYHRLKEQWREDEGDGNTPVKHYCYEG